MFYSVEGFGNVCCAQISCTTMFRKSVNYIANRSKSITTPTPF